MSRFGRNAPCPCGERKKYKACCLGKIDWEALSKGPQIGIVRHLSIRGKNKVFLAHIADVLQIDRLSRPYDWGEIKRGLTPENVRRLYEGVANLWPDENDLFRVLHQERQKFSGLYVGVYEPRAVLRGVTRYSLYADRILLVDPFLHPAMMREKYNPLSNPSRFLSNAAGAVYLWLQFEPWIEAGIVAFLHNPGEFDPSLMLESRQRTEARIAAYPELRALMKAGGDAWERLMNDHHEALILNYPDAAIVEMVREVKPDASPEDIENFRRYVDVRRGESTFFVEPATDSTVRDELWITSSGANYEIARIMANASGSHLITDIPFRWKEMELHRRDSKVDEEDWEPFAKAVQQLNWRRLENVRLHDALRLRKNERLESMRAFLRRTWRAAASSEKWSVGVATELAEELQGEYQKAESEWKTITTELIKWATIDVGVGSFVGNAVAGGPAGWLATAAIAGAAGVVAHSYIAHRKREDVLDRLPAAFFLGIRDNAD